MSGNTSAVAGYEAWGKKNKQEKSSRASAMNNTFLLLDSPINLAAKHET